MKKNIFCVKIESLFGRRSVIPTLSTITHKAIQVNEFKDFTVKHFLNALSEKSPVPGGGAVAALCAASACGLLCMVGAYSLGKGKPHQVEDRLKKALAESQALKDHFLELMDLDAQAYLKVVEARSENSRAKQTAKKRAAAVPLKIALLCRQAIKIAPLFVKEGSPYLLSDVEVAAEMLLAAYRSAMINVHANV